MSIFNFLKVNIESIPEKSIKKRAKKGLVKGGYAFYVGKSPLKAKNAIFLTSFFWGGKKMPVFRFKAENEKFEFIENSGIYPNKFLSKMWIFAIFSLF